MVNCRVGSLERKARHVAGPRLSSRVNCRIGSLEITVDGTSDLKGVNCRIGSLEIGSERQRRDALVNCRIGSLVKMNSVAAVLNLQIRFCIACRIASQGDAAFFYVVIEFAAPFRSRVGDEV